MAYVYADDLDEAKEKVNDMIKKYNSKHTIKVEVQRVDKTARQGLYFYRVQRKSSPMSQDDKRKHTQNFIKFGERE